MQFYHSLSRMSVVSNPRELCVNFFSFSFFFLGPHLRHMKVPRLEVQSELQLPAYTTAIATCDPSHIFDLYHSSRQCQILNPLREARDRTRNLTVPSQIHFHCTTMGIPFYSLFTATLAAYGSSQARGPIRAAAACLHHSHSNVRSKPHLRPTPQIMAMPDPQHAERSQVSNLHPHGY